MNYQQFILATKEEVAHLMDNSTQLQLHTTLKNNGKEKIGLSIITKNINISPTIYLEQYYTHFQNGMPIEEIAEHIVEVYEEVKFEHSWNVHVLKDYSQIKDKIAFKIVSAERNEAFLKNHPYVAYLDFAIVFFILHDVDETGSATIPITDSLRKVWDISTDELYEIAMKNTPHLLPPSFKPLSVAIQDLTGCQLSTDEESEDLMYVLTNPIGLYGAACVLYPDLLHDIGVVLGENYYILPSSIHEIFIVAESNCPSYEKLNEVIAEANSSQVDMEDILSDHAYYFNNQMQLLH